MYIVLLSKYTYLHSPQYRIIGSAMHRDRYTTAPIRRTRPSPCSP